MVTKAGVADGKRVLDLAVKLDDKGKVCDVVVDYAAPEEYLASADIFVLSKQWLIERVREHMARNQFHMDRDLVLGGWQKGEVSLNVYEFPGVVMYNDTVEEYFANNLALTDAKVRGDLFGYNHPVYTKVRFRVPTYYGEGCDIENSLVADGCMLEGKTQGSVLFRDVTIAPGANVENCVIMNDAVIGEGSELKYVILDKNVTIRPGSKLIGTKRNPIIIKRGEVV